MPVVYLITGATRGIGAELVRQILHQDDSSIVIAGVRNPSLPAAQKLSGLGERVVVVQLDSERDGDSAEAVKHVQSRGITHVDTIIANAGVAPDWCNASEARAEDMRSTFNVNVVGPLLLFQSFLPLLKKSAAPKFLVVSSGAGSLGIQKVIPFKSTIYGASKAALNLVSVRIAIEHPDIVSLALHPGLVKTDMADTAQKSVTNPDHAAHLDKELQSVEEGAGKILKLAHEAKLDSHSGKFWNTVAGTEMPW